MKRGVAWSIGGALVVAAWAVAAVTPAEDDAENPFPVAVDVGERGVGRNIAVTVDDVRRAGAVVAGDWSAEGNWVVVDLDAEAVASEFGALLAVASLEFDGRTFRASERPESLMRSALSVGIPLSGSLAFELPPDADPARATLTFGESPDPRLDSLIVVEVDLGEVPVEDEAELRDTDWSAP